VTQASCRAGWKGVREGKEGGGGSRFRGREDRTLSDGSHRCDVIQTGMQGLIEKQGSINCSPHVLRALRATDPLVRSDSPSELWLLRHQGTSENGSLSA
jgi:hypothetical protein